MKIEGRVFVVTGAGGGIGAELVRGLLTRGASVAAVDVRDEGLQRLQEEMSDFGNKLSLHTANITDKAAVGALPVAVEKAHGTVDAVINCAGIIQPFVKVQDLAYEAIDKVMAVNFFGTLYMTKAFLPHLLQRPEAHLINISSMGGFLPVPGQSVYGASKAAVKLLTEGLYAELLATKVHVTVVFPGATDTNITKNSDVAIPAVAGADAAKMAARMLPADKAARIILDGVEKNKPQIFTGSDSKFMNRLYRIHPVFATRFIAKQMKSLLKG